MSSQSCDGMNERCPVDSRLVENAEETQSSASSQNIASEPQMDTSVEQSSSSQSGTTHRGRLWRLESLFDTMFGQCTGGVKALSSYFATREGRVPECQVPSATLSELLHKQSRGKGRRQSKKDKLSRIRAPSKEINRDNFEIESVRCEDSVSAISACTLDEMSRSHDPKASLSRGVNEKSSPAKVAMRKGRSSTTHGSYQSNDQPSLSAATSGSSGGTDPVIRTKTLSSGSPVASRRSRTRVSRRATEQHSNQVSTKAIQEHDAIMSGLVTRRQLT